MKPSATPTMPGISEAPLHIFPVLRLPHMKHPQELQRPWVKIPPQKSGENLCVPEFPQWSQSSGMENITAYGLMAMKKTIAVWPTSLVANGSPQ